MTWVNQEALLTYFNYQGGHSLQLKILPATWFSAGDDERHPGDGGGPWSGSAAA